MLCSFGEKSIDQMVFGQSWRPHLFFSLVGRQMAPSVRHRHRLFRRRPVFVNNHWNNQGININHLNENLTPTVIIADLSVKKGFSIDQAKPKTKKYWAWYLFYFVLRSRAWDRFVKTLMLVCGANINLMPPVPNYFLKSKQYLRESNPWSSKI